MKQLRIILIIGILALFILIGYLLINNTTQTPATSPESSADFESVVPQELNDDEVQGVIDSIDQNTDVYRHIPRTGTPAYNRFMDLIAQDRFIFYSCELPNQKTTTGLMLVEAPSDALEVPEVSPILITATQWEPFMLQDIGQVLFPEVPDVTETLLTEFTEYELLPLVNGRTASFEIAGEQYELHYAWNLSYIFFASSRDCLELMAESVYSPYTH